MFKFNIFFASCSHLHLGGTHSRCNSDQSISGNKKITTVNKTSYKRRFINIKNIIIYPEAIRVVLCIGYFTSKLLLAGYLLHVIGIPIRNDRAGSNLWHAAAWYELCNAPQCNRGLRL